MNKNYEMLGVMVSKDDKAAIKKIADQNQMTMSYVARLLLSDSVEHIRERDIFRVVI